jgi:ribonucleoside-diphosphate reductase alpha chain
MYQDTKQLLSDAKFYEAYSRWSEEHSRFETWNEAVDRVMNMHKDYYAHKMNAELANYIEDATNAYRDKMILGAQRALQFGGKQLLKHEMKMYNCFHDTTKFVTSTGVKSFKDFSNGQKITVLTHTGKWKPAVVKSYGKQKLYQIEFSKGSNSKRVIATKDHRWLLSDGKETTSLKVDDRLMKEPKTFEEFSWEDATPIEQLYWCYGYVYGDGTVNGEYSMVRLCKKDRSLEERFLKMGFKSSSSASLEGDIMIYTGSYKKTLPDLEKDSPELIRAFVSGYLTADGERNYNNSGKQYKSIQASNSEAIEFIKKAFPIAGVHIISEYDLSGQETNFGIRDITSRFIICDSSGSKYNSGWKVKSIVPFYNGEQYDVWCLEVEDDYSFVLEGGIVTGNCTSSHCDRAEFFGEVFYILLCGAGAGFSVQTHHINKIPKLKTRTKQPKTHVVEDSIEGWATAVDVLMSSYFVGGGKYPEYEGRKIYFDLSQIRPKNAMISGGFKAPGPDPLRKALDRIEYLLQGIVLKEDANVLRPIHAYDIVMYIADAVLAGGVRRAATICLFSPEDKEMLNAKTGNWYYENPQRGRSNNSAVIVRDEVSAEQFSELMHSIKEFGEPGFVFVDDKDICYNPCVEVGMYPVFQKKFSGWQGCNLTEINGGMCDTPEKFYEACRTAAILGTLQAGYTNFKFLPDTTRKIFEREALLGVSITGWMNNPKVLFDEKVLEKGAQIVKETNEAVAKLIGINPAARSTCVKPSGNASVLLKTASGIHADHSPMYIRNVQMNKNSEVARLLKKVNPYMVEESVWSTHGTDYVISFPVIPNKGSLYKDDIIGVKHLELVKKAQKHWVESGTNLEYCVNKKVRHNVSNTIMVDDWKEVEDYVFKNKQYFAGISFIPMSGDKDYNQAPNTKVISADEIVAKYGTGSVFASGLIVDSFNIFKNLWDACATARGYGEDISGDDHNKVLKRDWVRRFDNFAQNYFDNDMVKAEHCLKDVHLLHKWEKIQQNIRKIDWKSELMEKKYIDIDTMGAAACAGVQENGEVGCMI